ncbi:MAG: hypothetical protein FWF84_02440 [Kiritimatiellaeota bacterium]|nr:hypothetical protein [Kiritimatiellota bacterium]
MKKSVVAGMVAAAMAMLGGGCATDTMKGTPFWSGEYAGTTGAPEDRVNLWPLAYYNAPALSILWPLSEYSDTSLAFRPLFSLYRDKPGEPYSELNILWPLSSFKLNRSRHHIFPVFWGDGYRVVFPLYWHFDSPRYGERWHGTDALFPLWIYDRHASGYDFWCLWPFTKFWHHGGDNHGWRVFPLAGYANENGDRSTWWLAGLGGRSSSDDASTHWQIPFYYYDRDGSETTFLSLPYSHYRSRRGDTTTAIPLLLSWWSYDIATEERNVYALFGLFHQRYNVDPRVRAGHFFPFYVYYNIDHAFYSLLYAHDDGTTIIPPLLSWWNDDTIYALLGLFRQRYDVNPEERSGHLIPLYAYSRPKDYFLSLPYARIGRTTVIPPLLSWQRRDAATHEKDTYILGGLYHNRSDADGVKENWLFPFYYYQKSPSLFVTPFWAHSFDDDGEINWKAIPPILSWQYRDLATDATSLYALGGLYHRRASSDGDTQREWLFPLYARGTDYFLSLPYARFDDTIAIPPLLAWQTTEAASGDARPPKNTYLLAGLFHQRHNVAPEQRAGHFIPFYAYDNADGTFYSLPYTRVGNTTVIPPLLSWQTIEAASGDARPPKNIYALLGLFHQKYGIPDDRRKGYFLPFYAYDNADRAFYTLLYGHWGKDDANYGGYYFTPLIGHRSQTQPNFTSRDRWFHPFYAHYTTNEKFTGDPLRHANALHLSRDTRRHYQSDTTLLFGLLGGFTYSQDFGRQFLHPSPRFAYTEKSDNYLFLFWSDSREKTLFFNDDVTEITGDTTLEESSILLFLYDTRRETSLSDNRDYVRRRVLWRLMHYERLNGDVSLDIFPAITYDAKTDGARKISFLWRFFRYETSPSAPTKLDLLFIPILR